MEAFGTEFESARTEVLVVPAWAYVLIFVMIVAVVAYIVVMQTRPDLVLGTSGDIRGPPQPNRDTPRGAGGGSGSGGAKVPEQMNTQVFTRYAENGIVRESYHQGGDHHVIMQAGDERIANARKFAHSNDLPLDES